MINLLKIYWKGDVGKITGYRQIDDNEMYDETRFKSVSDDVYTYVSENYEKGELTIPDTVINVTLSDITFTEFDDVVAMKNNALNVFINNELRDDNTSLDFFLISVKFIILNNQLAEKGFIFTPTNKEDVYLDVLNSGDEQSIEILEDYIEVLDAVTSYSSKVNNYISMKKAMTDLTDVQTILDTYTSYTGRNLIDDMNA